MNAEVVSASIVSVLNWFFVIATGAVVLLSFYMTIRSIFTPKERLRAMSEKEVKYEDLKLSFSAIYSLFVYPIVGFFSSGGDVDGGRNPIGTVLFVLLLLTFFGSIAQMARISKIRKAPEDLKSEWL